MNKTKLTVAERKAELEKQMAELEALEGAFTEIAELIETYTTRRDECLDHYAFVGVEENQSTNDAGELLFTHPDTWGRYPLNKWERDGYDITKCKPYHKDIYEKRVRTYDELSDWEKENYNKYTKLVELLESIEG